MNYRLTRNRMAVIAIGMITLMSAAAALARFGGAGTYDLAWNTIDSGGATFSTGAGFELGGTIGQPDAGPTMTGGNFQLAGGFWPGATIGVPIDTCPADIAPLPDGDTLINVDDLLAVINGWGACPAQPAECPADVEPLGGNGSVDVDDLLTIIGAWGVCP